MVDGTGEFSTPVRSERNAADGSGPSRPRVETRLAFVSMIAFWLFYFALNTFRTWADNADSQLSLMKRRLVLVCIGMVLTLILYAILRPLDRASMRLRVAVAFGASAVVSIAYAVFNYAIFYIYSPLDWVKNDTGGMAFTSNDRVYLITDAAIRWYFFIAAWAVLYIAMSNATQVRFAERQASIYQMEAQAAQLRALRYQLNPHFLFNSLNSLSTLVLRRETAEAEQMIQTLAAFLRSSLAADPAADVTLADEVGVQRLYLSIEQIRFRDRLVVQIDVPADLEAALLPGFLLQPLTENAVKFGISTTSRCVTISIQARKEGGQLHIAVHNDAAVLPDGRPGTGVGLKNVSDRLHARFGSKASCIFGPDPHGGFRVDLRMPLYRSTSMTTHAIDGL